MSVPTTLDPLHTVNYMDSAIQTLTSSISRYSQIVSVDMPSAKAKFLLSQLRNESLRALTAVAKTRALLAEMECLVVQKKIETLRAESPLADAIHSSKSRLQKRSFKRKSNVRKSIPNSSPSSLLHKLDNKSKAITKTSKNNSTCLTCVSSLAKSSNSLQSNKQTIVERPKYPTEEGLERKKSDSYKTVPINMNKHSKVDVTPNKSEIVIVSNNNKNPESITDAFDTLPNVSTSPIAKKIFGIANYNIELQKTVTHSRKDESGKTHQVSSRIATPRGNMTKKKPLKKAVESLKVSLPLNNVADKEIVIKLKKLPSEDTRREKPNTTDTSALIQSKNATNKNTKENTTSQVSLPLSSSTNNEKNTKIPPVVDKKEKQHRSQYRDVKEKTRVAKEQVIENIKEKPNLKETEAIKKYSVKLPKQVAKRNSMTVDNNKKQNEERNATSVIPSVSLPLTKSNLANFNRALQNTRSNNVEKIQTETRKEQSDKLPVHATSFMVSIPLNSCTVPNIETNTATNKENLDKSKCVNDEGKQSQKSQDKTPLFAWINIDWGSQGEHSMCNEKKSPAKGLERSEYKTWGNCPIRKVSWEMFTRRLNMSVPSTDQPGPDPPAKKICLEKRTDDAENRLLATFVTDNRMHEELKKLPVTTKPAEIEKRIEESRKQVVKPEMADNLEATNAVFKHIMMKKEPTNNQEDTRSISSDQTAIICSTCQCLHKTKVCPNRKYFKFLGVDNFKTEI